MIIGAEVAMLCMGLYLLVKGSTFPGKDAKFIVRGWPARFMGMLYVLPIPLSFLAGILLGVWQVAQGKDVAGPSMFWVGTALEAAILVACLVAGAIVYRLNRIPVVRSEAESMPTEVSL